MKKQTMIEFPGGGASCNPAPVRVLFKFTWLGLLESYFGDLFSLNSSLARYRFENKSPKFSGAKKRIISWIACLPRWRVNEPYEAGCPVGTHTLAMTERNTSKAKRCNKNVKNCSPLTVHRSLNNETVFSRFTSHFSLPTHAFTLAEVLITLGIIGIVAAMTLPVLIGKAERYILVQQFKKAYSNIQNIVELVQVENGMPYDCYSRIWSSELTQCPEFLEAFLSKMQVLQKCDSDNYDCHPKYKTKVEVLAAGGEEIRNTSCSYSLSGGHFYVLKDGSFLFLNDIDDVNTHQPFFAVDVNGNKGPNKFGYDMFYLSFYRENQFKNVVVSHGTCALKEKGGFWLDEVLLK